MKQGQFPEVIQLGGLNGQNGFKLDGENNNDQSGASVSAAGDINGDGYDDLLIGAFGYPTGKYIGRSYVVFGRPGIGGNGLINLANLTGSNGFKLNGDEANSESSGISVSTAGDINGDGHEDLIIGAYGFDNVGRSYVVFGGSKVGSSGLMNLTSLNGSNGFKLNGENKGDRNGRSVSAAGDINGDGHDDLIIMACGYPGGTFRGCSYVVFGGPGVGNTGIFNLSSLNGANGFKLDGENNGDCNINTGLDKFVSGAGDINGDGYADLLIGANGYLGGNNTGRSYLVFGGTGVGNSGILSLSNLTGINGFKLDGENNNDLSGQAVSAAGDINGDEYDDLIIGAWNYKGGRGRSYVVFGGLGIDSAEIFKLSSLAGANGFKIDGENNGDQSSFSVSIAGDINGDGYADLIIGAPKYNNTGRSYVVFGGPGVGYSEIFNLSSLTGANGFKLDGENNNDYSGASVSIAGDINGDGVLDLIIGTNQYPAGGNKGRSYVVFGDIPPVLINNSLSLYANETVRINSNHLAAYDRNHDNNTLLFIPTNLTHGQFESIGNSGKIISNFTQQQILNGSIQFVHDGGAEPTYNITVRSSGIAWIVPMPADITFTNFLLENNRLIINQGENVILTPDDLKATFCGKADGNLTFIVSNLVHGQFEFFAQPNQPIVIFQQQNITDGMLQFVHDDTESAPGYQITVSNGVLTDPPQTAVIDFDTKPVIVNNRLVIDQGQTVQFTAGILSAVHHGATNNGDLRFDLFVIQQGQFSWVNTPSESINGFYQQNITEGLVQFTHDNSILAPAYNVSVTDGRARSLTQAAEIDFDTTPLLLNNSLRINQNQTVILTSSDLKATHPGKPDNTLQFVVSQLTHGNFSFISVPQFPLKTFQQQNITDGVVQFTQDGSAQPPTYAISVTDGRISTPPQFAVIDFDLLPILVNNQLKISQGQTVALTTDNLLATHVGVADPQLTFIITNISNGRFIVPGKDIQSALFLDTTFQQQQIMDKAVLFYQQGTDAPAYSVSVSDGRVSTSPQLASIAYSAKPVLQNNQFAVSKGQPVVLTTDNLLAMLSGQALDMLQFLVPIEMTHGQYERRGASGVEITSFYQKDVSQQNILFVHDNSTLPPDGDLVVWDSSTGLSTDAQETHTLLLLNNHLPINQGETLTLTLEMLQAASNQVAADNIIFTPMPGTVQYGNFFLKTTPNYPITNFRQSQMTSGDIVFVPDGSAKAPTCFLTLSDGQLNGASGTFSCGVDFDTSPTLDRAYLSIAPRETVSINNLNLKASSNRFPAGALLFEISELSHGFFADIDHSEIPLLNFTQQAVMDNRILFTADNSSLSPEFQISVWDSRMHCVDCPKPADVVFQSGGQSNNGISDVIRNAIISAVASGVIGLLFFALKYKHSLSLQRNARPTIDGEEQNTYSDALLLPIAREIFSRIKITGCLGYIGERDYNEYIGAVSMIVAALETKGIIQPDHWNSLPRPKKQKIIDSIAMHTKELVGNNRCCSTRTFTSFYRAEATPKMIRDQAEAIAAAVQKTLSDRTEAKDSHSSVRLTGVDSSLNESQIKTPLLS